MHPVDAYARDVTEGRIPAGRYHRLACARHLADRAREGTPGFPYRFDAAKAEQFLTFARLMKHYKGRQFAGKAFEPTPVQVFRLGSVFGWRHVETGHRRFTTAYNELPRKSGKSFEAAVVGVYVTFFEGEAGAEGYCIATKEQQARIVFDAMKRLVKSSGLSSRIQVNARNLHREQTAQKLEPLGSDSDTTDGLNPHLIITDEFHAHKTRALIDVMESATGARVNPLHFQITTAGDDLVSPCGDQHLYACQILDGALEDDPSTLSFFAFIAHADPEDDPFDEATWIKANPHWGISINPEDMRKMAAKARKMPSAAAEFKQKRLNLWVNAAEPWLSMDGWRAGQSSWSAEDMRHESCYVGIDMASKIDLCAMVALFPPTAGRERWRVLRWVWTPADTLVERGRRDRAPYNVWVQQGHLLTTPGSRIDHRVIREALAWIRERFDLEAVGFDPWHADKIMTELIEDDGMSPEQVVEVPQTFSGLSSACLHLEAEVLEGRVDAGGCPVMSWAASNAVVQRDGKDNIQPIKKRSRGRIDPITALCIARRLALIHEATPAFRYLSEGVRSLGE